MYAIVVESYGNIYVVTNFTQTMCEMSPHTLADYVSRNHVAKIK